MLTTNEHPILEKVEERPKAAIITLVRNRDLEGMKRTLRTLEERFNNKYKYPYIFLNDEPFTELFKEEVSKLINAKITFGLVPKEHWSIPEWLDAKKVEERLEDMARRGVKYGKNLNYRHMCRFFSGLFFKHPLLADLEYTWRIEPDVEFYCDIDYDPFVFMKRNKKKYGWNVIMPELMDTVPTLGNTVQQYKEKYKDKLTPTSFLDVFMSESGDFSGCHFWGNFEIIDLSFVRSPEYQSFFDHLDRAGGFYYERWGDAPVKSIATGLFLSIDQVHYFEDIGYMHDDLMNCPASAEIQKKCRNCPPSKNVNYPRDCYRRYKDLNDRRLKQLL